MADDYRQLVREFFGDSPPPEADEEYQQLVGEFFGAGGMNYMDDVGAAGMTRDASQAVLEGGAMVGSSLAGMAVGGLNLGMRAGDIEGGTVSAREAVEGPMNKLTYEPKSEPLRGGMQAAGEAMAPAGNWLLEKRDQIEPVVNENIGPIAGGALYAGLAVAANTLGPKGTNLSKMGSKELMRGGNKVSHPRLEPVASRMDAEKRWSDGETLYGVHEMDETAPSEITSLDMLNAYTPDQLYFSSDAKPRAVAPVGNVYDAKAEKVLKSWEDQSEWVSKAEKVWQEQTGLPIDATADQVERAVRKRAFQSGNNPDELVATYMDLQKRIDEAYTKMGDLDQAYNTLKYRPEGFDESPVARPIATEGDKPTAERPRTTAEMVKSITERQNALKPRTESLGNELKNAADPEGRQRGSTGTPDDETTKVVNDLAATTATRSAAGRIETASDKPELKASAFHSSGKAATSARKENFSQALSEARQKMKPADAAQVDPLDPNFKGQVYMTDDGAAGFALSEDGYVSNLFRHPDAPFNGTMGAALTKARAAGAKNLDAFDTYLAKGYISRGAVETGRTPWDPKYANEEITNALGDKKPDYVSMGIGGVIPERKHSELLGPRPQNELARYRTTPTGKPVAEPKSVAPMFKGGRVNRLKRIAGEGVKEGGEKWYWMGGLLDKFVLEFGEKLGVERFDEFMKLNAAVSPRSAVSTQIKRASVLYQRLRKGEPIAPLTAEMFPPGYGHLATTTAHAPAVERIVNTGEVGNAIKQPKITSYADNQMGNYQPLTADSHNFQILSADKKNPKGVSRSPSVTEYPFIEERQAKIAEQMGLQPSEFQAALWVGGKNITGVRDARNLTAQMNQRIAATAEKLDIPEEEALIRFMNGDTILYSAMIGLFGAEIFSESKKQNAMQDGGG